MGGLETGRVSSSVMQASSSTAAICTMMLHRTGSLRALKISVGGCAVASMVMGSWPGGGNPPVMLRKADYFHNYHRACGQAPFAGLWAGLLGADAGQTQDPFGHNLPHDLGGATVDRAHHPPAERLVDGRAERSVAGLPPEHRLGAQDVQQVPALALRAL